MPSSTMTRTVSSNNKKKNKGASSSSSSSSSSADAAVAVPSNAVRGPRNWEIFETILGTELWKKSEKLDKTVAVPLREALQGKEFVALYFGAQWSSYSTRFTTILVDFYNQVGKNASNNNNNNTTSPLEIIYVSSDQTQEEFDAHYGAAMPWTSLVADQPELCKKRTELTPLFKGFRIPAMVILHVPTGQFVTEHGVKHVTEMMAAIAAADADASSKEEEAKTNEGTTGASTSSSTEAAVPTPPSVQHTLEMWRNTSTKSIQDAHKLIDYGGGTMSLLLFLYQNPYIVVAIAALCVTTPILKAIWQKPMVIIGFMFLVKRYLTPKGDQSMPGQLVTINNNNNNKSSSSSSSSTTGASSNKKGEEAAAAPAAAASSDKKETKSS